MCPSLFERENYCFSLYELCPLFFAITISEDTAKEIIELGYRDLAYV
jgi:hypothetical protein